MNGKLVRCLPANNLVMLQVKQLHEHCCVQGPASPLLLRHCAKGTCPMPGKECASQSGSLEP